VASRTTMAVEFKDYYETLGVSRTATPDEIKQAFRKLARQYHPDVAKNKAAGEAKFKEINEAYDVLSDPEKRRRYDELGANWDGSAPPPPRHRPASDGTAGPDFEFGGSTGFSDFFESFFGGGRSGFARGWDGRAAGRADDVAFPGEDVEADLLVTLEEALRGAVRKVSLRRVTGNDGPTRTDTYQVRIPPGVREGQRIRLAGQGSPGHGGGAPGDLYLRVRLARHPDFTVQGADLHCDLPVAPWEAALGVKAELATLDGATTVRVPPGTSSGSKLRLRGLGLPRDDGHRGDLYATVQIQVPPFASDQESQLWEQLARTSSFNPRSSS
jgi:curved DNA-binding protein